MTQKEKAKAYDEALKVLHKYDGVNIMFSQDLKEEMFPELREPENEKIRKWLIYYFKEACDNVSEKEKKGVLAWLESQGEQKPAEWSKEDEINNNICTNLMQTHSLCDKDIITWFESLKDRVQPQNTWKPTEEQIETLKYACGGNYVNLGILESLYKDLKKL